jgi:hypothetical protein
MALTQSRSRRPNRQLPKFMARTVMLTGFDTTGFLSCLQNIQGIYEIFSRRVGDNMLLPWIPDSFLQWPGVFASSRYFTDMQRHSYEEPIPFDRMEDPDGVLTSMSGGHYAHCEDNKVEYFRLNGEK